MSPLYVQNTPEGSVQRKYAAQGISALYRGQTWEEIL